MESARLLTLHHTDEADQSQSIELHQMTSPTLHSGDTPESVVKVSARQTQPRDIGRSQRDGMSCMSDQGFDRDGRTLANVLPQDDAALLGSRFADNNNNASTTLPLQYNTRRNQLSEQGYRPTAVVDPGYNDESIDRTDHKVCTVVGAKAILTPSDSGQVYWTSIWLRRRTLLALLALFAGLFTSLIIVWLANKSQHGFRPILSNNHYAWTYGPTAVLVVVMSLWRQIDYQCKMMQPWQELRDGSASADRSLLLDYLSPLNITSFARAVRCRHVPVVASIAGFTIIKAVTIFSTGLLTLTPVSVTDTYPIALTTSFDSGLIWDTVTTDSILPGTDTKSNVASLFKTIPLYQHVPESPVHAYVKSLREGAKNNTMGILDTVAFQTFDFSPEPGLLSISVDVEAFFPEVSCEVAKPTLIMRPNDKLVVQLDSDTCSAGAQYQSEIEVRLPWPQTEIVYNMWRVNCSERNAEEKYTLFDAHTLYDFRFAMLIGDLNHLNLTYNDKDGSHNTLVAPNTAAVICKMDYAMHLATVLQDFTSQSYSLQQRSALPGLNNFTGMMLGEMIYSALNEADSFKLDKLDTALPIFSILPQVLDGQEAKKRFLSSEELQSSAGQVFAGVGAFFVRDNFLKNVSTEVNGTAVRVEDRLLIGLTSLWLMLVGFGLVIPILLCILYTAPRNVVPGDPRLIATDALIVSSSPALRDLLDSCHDMRSSHMTSLLHNVKFSTTIDEAFQIEFMREEMQSTAKGAKTKRKHWIPMPAQSPMICVTLILPLAAIVTLEVLYRISAGNGFADVSGLESNATYLSRYGSALVVLLIATSFNSLDFTTATFAPYSCLRSGPVHANRSVSLQIIGSPPPVALFRSMKSRHWSSFLSNLAGMVGSVLTIVASGLWVIDRRVIVEHAAMASPSSSWDIEWFNSSASGDAGAAQQFDRIQHGSASMPTSIFQHVVLPSIANIRYPLEGDVARARQSLADPVQSFVMPVEGLRPLLDCEVIDDEHITIEWEGALDDFQRQVRVYASPPLPNGCQRTDSDGSNYNFTSDHWFTGVNETTYLGDFYDLHLGPQASGAGFDEALYGDWQMDNPAGCPSIGAIFATVTRHDVRHDDIVAVICSQKVQQIQVNVTYTGVNLTNPKLSTTQAPILLENSARNLTNGTEGIDTFPYRVQRYLLDSTKQGNVTEFLNVDSTLYDLDPFMNHLIFGPDHIVPGNILGKSNQQNFIKAVNNLYAKYMSLVIDMHFRQPLAEEAQAKSPGDAGLLLGTASVPSSWIKVNATSKLIMQAMLGTMTLLGLLTFLLTDLRSTLPRKPTSIASRMALLAGSDLCAGDLLPRDAVCKSDKDLARIFDGWLFSLGWWAKSGMDIDHDVEHPLPEGGAASRRSQRTELRRFGIDVGAPEQLGFRRRKW
jgi:hypothetical protein